LSSPALWTLGLLALALGARAARIIWSAGQTWNDAMVLAIVLGCIGIYPVLAWGALEAGDLGPALGIALGTGATAVWALFEGLDRRVELGRVGMAAAAASQLGLGFALWAGLIVLLRAPFAALQGGAAAVAWPGGWLWLPLVLSLGALLWTWRRRAHLQRVRVPGPPAVALPGGPLRVAHLSDLHVSPVMRGAELDELLATALAEDPDIIVITGDLVMPFSEQHHPWLVERLRSLELPCLVCPGNHDTPVAGPLKAELEAVGVRWLADDRAVLPVRGGDAQVEVVGLDFRWSGLRRQLDAVLAAHPPPVEVAARILLVHDPRVARLLPPGRFDLTLCGHTHGGQVGLDPLGLRLTAVGLLGQLDQGLFQLPGGPAYVNRGAWRFGFPPRLGVGPEVALIELGPGALSPRDRSAR